MKKYIITVLVLFLTACSTAEDVKKTEPDENNNLTNGNVVWNGPTEGPWETWNRNNNGDQFLKYEMDMYDSSSVGFLTIDIVDLGNETYEYSVEIQLSGPAHDKTWNESSTFIVEKAHGLREAVFGEAISGELKGFEEYIGIDHSLIITDIIERSVIPIVWEENTTTMYYEGTASEIALQVGSFIEYLEIPAFEVELLYGDEADYIDIDGNRIKPEAIYIISPDIRYPLYVYHQLWGEYTEWTLIEYSYN